MLLLARTTLSQMDVPTRQALVMTVVTPESAPPPRRSPTPPGTPSGRSARWSPGLVQQLALGAPLVVAGAVKAGYDLALWGWARHLGLTSRDAAPARPAAGPAVTASPGEPP